MKTMRFVQKDMEENGKNEQRFDLPTTNRKKRSLSLKKNRYHRKEW